MHPTPLTLKIPRGESCFYVECYAPNNFNEKFQIIAAEDERGRTCEENILVMIEEFYQDALLVAKTKLFKKKLDNNGHS